MTDRRSYRIHHESIQCELRFVSQHHWERGLHYWRRTEGLLSHAIPARSRYLLHFCAWASALKVFNSAQGRIDDKWEGGHMRLIYDLSAMPRLLYLRGKHVQSKGKLENKSTRHVECKRGHVVCAKCGKVAQRSCGARESLVDLQ
jgi:hypothetical protein